MAKKTETQEPTGDAVDETKIDEIETGPLDELDMGFTFPEEVEAEMSFDPFDKPMEGDPEPELDDDAKVEAEAKAAAEAKPEPAADAVKPESAADPAAPATPAAVPLPPEVAATIDGLKETIANLSGQVTSLQATAAPKADDAPTGPTFMREVPAAMMQLLGSEDITERTQGVQALVAGVGQMIYTQVMQDVDVKFNTQVESSRNESAKTEKMQAAARDFYTAFPQLNHESIRPLVSAESLIVFREMNAKDWSTGLRDAIGTRVLNKLKQFSEFTKVNPGDNGGAGDGEKPLVPTNPKPPEFVAGGNRPASASESTVAADVAETLGLK